MAIGDDGAKQVMEAAFYSLVASAWAQFEATLVRDARTSTVTSADEAHLRWAFGWVTRLLPAQHIYRRELARYLDEIAVPSLATYLDERRKLGA